MLSGHILVLIRPERRFWLVGMSFPASDLLFAAFGGMLIKKTHRLYPLTTYVD